MDLISNAEVLRAQPAWIDTMRAMGEFGVMAHGWGQGRLKLADDQNPAVATLVWALTDPGERAEGAPPRRVSWTPDMAQAFKRVVQDFLSEAAAKPHYPQQDLFVGNGALLLAAACAGGDADSAVRLMQAVPGCVSAALSQRLLHGEDDRHGGIAAVMLAVRHGQLDVLRAMADAGWDPLGTVDWHFSDDFIPFGSAFDGDPRGFLEVLEQGVSWAREAPAEVLRFFFEAVLRAIGEEEEPAASVQQALVSLSTLAGWVCDNTDGEEIRQPLIDSGVMAQLAPGLAGRAAAGGDLELLRVMRGHFAWDDDKGEEFVPLKAWTSVDNLTDERRLDVTMKLVRWCIEDGAADVLTDVFVDPDGKSNCHALHFARTGCSPVMMLLLERGLEPGALAAQGLDIAAAAEEAGHPDVAALVRSFDARRQAHRLIDALGHGTCAPMA